MSKKGLNQFLKDYTADKTKILDLINSLKSIKVNNDIQAQINQFNARTKQRVELFVRYKEGVTKDVLEERAIRKKQAELKQMIEDEYITIPVLTDELKEEPFGAQTDEDKRKEQLQVLAKRNKTHVDEEYNKLKKTPLKEDLVKEQIRKFKILSDEEKNKITQCRNEIQLIGIKKELRQLCNSLPELEDPTSIDLPLEPRFTPCGHCCDRELTENYINQNGRTPLNYDNVSVDDLMPDNSLTALVESVLRGRQLLMQSIENIQSIDDKGAVQESIQKFNETKKKEFEVLQTIFRLKKQLKLNNHNREDLEYWHNQTNHCWHGFGGIKIKHERTGHVFRIPTRIHEMMRVANNVFLVKDDETIEQSVNRFMGLLNQARSKKPSIWNNPFSFCTRKTNTDLMYAPNTILRDHKVL